MKKTVLLFMLLSICGLAAGEMTMETCSRECCTTLGGTYDNGCKGIDINLIEEDYEDCRIDCSISTVREMTGTREAKVDTEIDEVPDEFAFCMAGCCEDFGGTFDMKTGYCEIKPQTTQDIDFQECQLDCIAQALDSSAESSQNGMGMEGTPAALEPASEAGSPGGGSTQGCMSLALPALSLIAAALMKSL